MFDGREITDLLEQLGFTHVIWLPDSTLGQWEDALERSRSLQLIRVCREGEAWPLAAGLAIGGARPLVMMQCTGFYESGDALRNVVFDLKVPIVALVGVRNWLIPESSDSAKRFAPAIGNAWGVDSIWVSDESDKQKLNPTIERWHRDRLAGIIWMAEGSG